MLAESFQAHLQPMSRLLLQTRQYQRGTMAQLLKSVHLLLVVMVALLVLVMSQYLELPLAVLLAVIFLALIQILRLTLLGLLRVSMEMQQLLVKLRSMQKAE